MKVLIVLACVVALVAGKAVDPSVELPSTLTICKLNDPKRDECIRDSMQVFLPSLRRKTENFDFPAVDPFTYDSLTIDYKNSNLMSGSITVRDVKTYGMSRGKVKNVKSDFTDGQMTLNVELHYPKIFSTGKYRSNMTFNAFKINSKGQYNITMRDVNAKWTIKGKQEEIDGEKFMKIFKFDIIPEANDVKISMSGLFPDETLNKVANDFFNQNWRMLYKEMVPETRKQWQPILIRLTNQFFSQIPFKRLLIQD